MLSFSQPVLIAPSRRSAIPATDRSEVVLDGLLALCI